MGYHVQRNHQGTTYFMMKGKGVVSVGNYFHIHTWTRSIEKAHTFSDKDMAQKNIDRFKIPNTKIIGV